MKRTLLNIMILNLFSTITFAQTINVEQKSYLPYNNQPTYSYSKNMSTGEQKVSISPLPGVTISGNTEPTPTLPAVNQQSTDSPPFVPYNNVDKDKAKAPTKETTPFVNEVTLVNPPKKEEEKNYGLIEYQKKYVIPFKTINDNRVNNDYLEFINQK